MYSTINVNIELTRLRQQELRDQSEKLHREQPRANRSPVLTALGRQMINFGQKLQQSAHSAEQPVYELHTKQA